MIDKINKLFLQISEFYTINGINVYPLPKLVIDKSNNEIDNINIKTAQYDSNRKEITVYVSNRHIKDIMRSISHELYHHHQNIINPSLMKKIDGDDINNDITIRCEMDAYMFGNIIFRKWCEHLNRNSK